jgi:beta-N-acetylhexosaminidase
MCHFTPAFWRHSGESCSGLQVHVTDRDAYRPVETGVHLLSTIIALQGNMFKFTDPTYDRRRHFDLLAGTDKLRISLMNGEPVEKIVSSWEPKLRWFKRRREKHLLYGE